ncbi:MAG TPA: phosphatase PAP2 family protein [Sphingomonas sp.]
MHHAIPRIPGGWLAAGVALTVAGNVCLLLLTHLSIQITAESVAIALGAAIAGIARYAMRAPRSRAGIVARDAIENFALFALLCLLGAVASYPVAAESAGFVDPSLVRFDRLLHFDWPVWYGFVAMHPLLQRLGRLAYVSIFVTPAILLGYFAMAGRQAEARLFIATFWLAALITLGLFPFMPAQGPLVFLLHSHVPYMPLSATYQSHEILALRAHHLRDVDLDALHGLVCVPSFHAISAVLYIATAWRAGALRWPIMLVNVAMLLATPVEGTHYLVDLAAGAIVALIALVTTPILVKLRCPADLRDGARTV